MWNRQRTDRDLADPGSTAGAVVGVAALTTAAPELALPYR
jgi:hypothetical protein